MRELLVQLQVNNLTYYSLYGYQFKFCKFGEFISEKLYGGLAIIQWTTIHLTLALKYIYIYIL